ncbi:unnamed protein product, partial [Brassica napus]
SSSCHPATTNLIPSATFIQEREREEIGVSVAPSVRESNLAGSSWVRICSVGESNLAGSSWVRIWEQR